MTKMAAEKNDIENLVSNKLSSMSCFEDGGQNGRLNRSIRENGL